MTQREKNKAFWAKWRDLLDTRAAPLLHELRNQWAGLDDEGTPPSYPGQRMTLRTYCARAAPELFGDYA